MKTDNYDIEEADDLELSEDNEATQSFLSKAWNQTKISLMGTLFVMAKEIRWGFKSNLIGMFIDCLQILSFPFHLQAQFPWNEKYASWFAILCHYSKMEFYISYDDETYNLIIYIVSILLVSLNLANAVSVGVRFYRKQVQNVFLLKILRSVMVLLSTFLYLPVLSFYCIILSCNLNYYNFPGCPSEYRGLMITSSVIILTVFSLVTIIVTASFVEPDPCSKDIRAQPHARVELIYLLLKCGILVQFYLYGQPQYQPYMIFTILTVGFTMTTLYILYLPFYHYRTNVIKASFLGTFTWAGICLLVAYLWDRKEDAAPIMLFYVGTIWVWIFINYLCELRVKKLVRMTPDSVSNVYEVELTIRFLLLRREKTLRLEHLSEDDELIEYIEEFYFRAERRFPDSSLLRLFLAQFFVSYIKSMKEAIEKINHAEKLQPKLDEQFIIYKRKQMVTEGGSDAIKFVTFNSRLEAAHRAESKAVDAQVSFWSALYELKSENFDTLCEIAGNLTSNIANANTHYEFLKTLDSTHPRMLRMYAYYLQDVIHDYELFKSILNRAENMEENRERLKQQADIKRKENVEEAVLEILVDARNFGKVSRVNEDCKIMLGKPKCSMINKSISLLLPEPFNQELMVSLKNISEGYEEITEQPRELLMIDEENYLCEVLCYIEKGMLHPLRPNTSNLSNIYEYNELINIERPKIIQQGNKMVRYNYRNSSSYEDTLVLKMMPVFDKKGVILLDSTFKILFFNSNAGRLLGITPDMQIMRNIRDFIYDFDAHYNHSYSRANAFRVCSSEMAPIQTFIVSSRGKLTRIRINFSRYFNKNHEIIILSIRELNYFSRQTQRFFANFVLYLRDFIKDEHKKIKSRGKIDNSVSNEEDMNRYRKLKNDIRRFNKEFSPELSKLRNIVRLLLIISLALYVVTFILGLDRYEDYRKELKIMNHFSSMQSYSLVFSSFTLLLDLSRRGYEIPFSSENILTKMKDSFDKFSVLVREMKSDLNIDEKTDDITQIINYDKFYGFSHEIKTPIESLYQQLVFVQTVTENSIDKCNVLENNDAFWLFENGFSGIFSSLNYLSHGLMTATDEILIMEPWVWSLVVGELICCVILFGFAIKYISISEITAKKVMRMFLGLPLRVINALKCTAENNYRLLRHENYPENKTKKNLARESYLDMLKDLEKNPNKLNTTKERRLMVNERSSVSLIKSIRENSLMKAITIFTLILISYIVLVQVLTNIYILPRYFEYATKLLKYSGDLSLLISRTNLFLLNTVLSYPPQYLNSTTAPAYINFSSFTSMEQNYNLCMNETNFLEIYSSAFLIRNDNLDLPSGFYQTEAAETVYEILFKNGCDYSDLNECPEELDKLLTRGIYNAIQDYVFEVRDLATKLFRYYRVKPPEEKWAAVQADLNSIIKLDIDYLWPLSLNFQKELFDFYLEKYYQVYSLQIIELTLFIALHVVFYVFIFIKYLYRQDNRKKLIRSMILLLPYEVFRFTDRASDSLSDLTTS
jgi:PAS domain-containing protein